MQVLVVGCLPPLLNISLTSMYPTILSIQKAILSDNLSNLEELNLSKTLTEDSETNGTLLSTLIPSIISHCLLLNKLDLSKNILASHGACVLGEYFVPLTTKRREFKLDLSDTSIGTEAMLLFSNKVAEMLKSLAPFLVTISSECDLILQNNPLGHDGLKAISRLLRSELCPVTKLNLDETDTSSDHLLQSSQCSGPGEEDKVESSSLTELRMCNNKLGGHIYLDFMVTTATEYLFTNLEKLYLTNILIEDNSKIGEILKLLLITIASYCPCLNHLDISENNIGVHMSSALGEAFPLFICSRTQTVEIHMDKCNINDEAMIAFSDQVSAKMKAIPKQGFSECHLYFDENSLEGSEGVLAILKMLTVCPITYLDICNLAHHVTETQLQHVSLIASDNYPNTVVESSNLTNLDMRNTKIRGCCHIKCLEIGIVNKYLTNLEWLCLSNTLSDNAKENGVLLCTLLPAIASHCPCLETLDLSKNNLGVPGADALGEAFLQLVSVGGKLDIDLSEASFNSEAVIAFIEKATHASGNFTVSRSPIAEITLTLNENPIGYKGLVSILKMVSTSDFSFSELSIRNITVPDIMSQSSSMQRVRENQIQIKSDVILRGGTLSTPRVYDRERVSNVGILCIRCMRRVT